MKRTIALILILTFISAALISCNKPRANNINISDGNSNIENETPAGDIINDEQIELKPADENYGGYTFRIAGFNSYGGGWKAFDYSEVASETISGDPINDAVYNRNAKVEELYNIKIKEVLYGGLSDDYSSVIAKMTNIVMAGSDEFDAGLSPGNSMPKLIGTKNMTYDLFSIPEFDLAASWWDQNCVKNFSLAGKLHSVSGDISLWNSMGLVVFYANKKIIKDCGLENPYDLVRSGKWTWDKMGEMARGAVRDINGDGVIDRFDQIGIASEEGTMGEAVLCAGERFSYKDADDMPVLNTNYDRISAVLDKAMPVLRSEEYAYASSDLYGKYPNPYFNFTMPKFQENQTLFYTQQLMVALDLREMEADFSVLPFPKLDENQDQYYSCATDYFVTYAWLPVTGGETARSGNILQAMGYYSQQMVIPALFDVTITNKALRDEDSLEMLEIIKNSRVYDFFTIYNWGDMLNIYNNIYNKRTNNLFSAVEKSTGKIEAAMKKTIDELMK